MTERREAKDASPKIARTIVANVLTFLLVAGLMYHILTTLATA